MADYCLRWNNHRPNLVTVFSELLTSEALVDVTLATDGHYIRAHKLVLSACSIYFKDLFASSPCKHPIVILKDISIEALKTVIDFIYRGEVTVSQDKLPEVLRTAESLRIKGLTDNPRSYEELPSHGLRNTSSSFSSQATRQRSSLTDSRDQSLSLEGEEDGEPGTPPSSKKRKVASEHDSIESSQDDAEPEENNGLGDIKPEPSEDRDNERSMSRETESEYNLGVSTENSEDNTGAAAGPSDSSTTQQSQGSPLWTLPFNNPWWASMLPAFSHHRLHRPILHPPVSRALTHPSLSGTHMGIGRNLVTGSPSGDISSAINSVAAGCGRGSPRLQHQPPPPSSLAPLDKLALVAALGKEVSPQMIQALQAVAQRRESFSSAAKLYSVSVTTLWRYFKKLGIADANNAGLSQGGSRPKISAQSKKLTKSDSLSSSLSPQGLPEGIITPRVILPPKIVSPPPYESPFNAATASIFPQGGTEAAGDGSLRVALPALPPLKVDSPPPYPSPTNSSPAPP